MTIHDYALKAKTGQKNNKMYSVTLQVVLGFIHNANKPFMQVYSKAIISRIKSYKTWMKNIDTAGTVPGLLTYSIGMQFFPAEKALSAESSFF